jgi:hypothetical protein
MRQITSPAMRAAKQIDKQIEAAFYRHCVGLQIPIMQISAIYAAGRLAAKEGRDLEAAVKSAAHAIALDR